MGKLIEQTKIIDYSTPNILKFQIFTTNVYGGDILRLGGDGAIIYC